MKSHHLTAVLLLGVSISFAHHCNTEASQQETVLLLAQADKEKAPVATEEKEEIKQVIVPSEKPAVKVDEAKENASENAEKADVPKKKAAPKAEATPKKEAAPKTEAAPKKEAAPKAEAAPKKEAAPKTEAAPKKEAAPKTEAAPKKEATPKAEAAPKKEATPKAEAAPKKEAAAPTQTDVNVARIAIATAVENREPQNTGDQFSPDVERLFCFTQITGVRDTAQIFHKWYRNNQLVSLVPLRVASMSWRTFSSKPITPEETGQWHVEVVLGDEEKVLETINFKVE